jgi:hypothetical protein
VKKSAKATERRQMLGMGERAFAASADWISGCSIDMSPIPGTLIRTVQRTARSSLHRALRNCSYSAQATFLSKCVLMRCFPDPPFLFHFACTRSSSVQRQRVISLLDWRKIHMHAHEPFLHQVVKIHRKKKISS